MERWGVLLWAQDLISRYAELCTLDIQDARDRQNLDGAIQATSHLSPTSARSTMGDVCDDALKALEKTFADWPLPPAGPGVEMNEKSLKTFGQTTTLTGVDFGFSVAILDVLIKTHF